jgi:hypothetical protein
MSSSEPSLEPLAVEVSCIGNFLRVSLSDGREVGVPLEWFPRLLNATPEQRKGWSLIGRGMGIHWESVDEDILVESLLTPEKMMWARGYGPENVRRRSRSRNGARPAFRSPARNGRRVLKTGA